MEQGLIAGRYRILQAVGRGGMGTVWLCHDEMLDRNVALKQIRMEPGEETASARRALREARLSAAVNHENAVSLYNIVDHEGAPWLVMEYVPSRNLSTVLRDEESLAVSRVVRIGAQLASALAHAHALGIIHRDIKPSNILIGADDLAKISDFGIARGHTDERITLTGLVTGTPAYFSPELARGGEPSQAADVWALGATLYAAVEGHPPYESSSNPLALLGRIASESPPRPVKAGELTPLLATMLDRSPATRASMLAVSAALAKLAHPTDVGASRARQRDRAYSDTTLHQQPVGAVGALGEMLERGRARDADETTAVSSAVASPTVSPIASVGQAAGGAPEAAPPVAAPPPDVPPVAGSSASGDAGRPGAAHRPSAALLALAAIVVLVCLVGAGLLWVKLASSPGDDDTAAVTPSDQRQSTSSGTTPTRTSAGSTAVTPPVTLPTPPATTPTPPATTPTRTTTSSPPPASPGGGSVAAFTATYFNTVPADTSTGWGLLAPSYQQRIGRSSYESFWGSIDSTEVTDIDPTSSSSVNYTITYHFSNGEDSVERKRLTLVPSGGSYLISDDTTVTSSNL